MKTFEHYMSNFYRIEIIEDKEESGFVVSYPELPGCISCGETVESALENAKDAKKEWIKAALEENIEIPEPDSLENYSGQFKLRIPRSLHRSLAEHSGAVFGLTRGTNKAHFVRATVESLAYETSDVLAAMEMDAGLSITSLRVDGGASANNFLMQFQADIENAEIVRPVITETTALGAAYLAGLAVGYYDSLDEIKGYWKADRRFEPGITGDKRATLLAGWKDAVERTRVTR